MNGVAIQKKIKEVEDLLEQTPINQLTFEFYDKLLDIKFKLWQEAYFKKFQEKDYLKKQE